MNRRVIQIATTECANENNYSRFIFALASDGSMWEMCRSNDETTWKRVVDLPVDPDYISFCKE